MIAELGQKCLEAAPTLKYGPLKSCITVLSRGVAGRGGPGVPVTPLGRPSFEQTTYNIQAAKTPWQYLGRKSHCWKAHFFKMCFFVKYFRQRLSSLVNMGLHAAIIGLTIWWVASVTPPPPSPHPLKNPGYAPAQCLNHKDISILCF